MTKEELRALVEKHAASAKDGETPSLQALFDMLEPLVEDTGLQARLSKAVVEHLEEKNTEIASIRTARNSFLWVSFLLIIAVLTVFYWTLISPAGNLALAALGDARIAFVSATFISGFGLLAIILRGIFRAGDQDDSGGPMVDSVKTLFQLARETLK